MNKICQHGIKLEKNIRCDHGYAQVFIKYNGRTLCKNFGPHDHETHERAKIYLGKLRFELRERKIGIEPELPSKPFHVVAGLWLDLWKNERNPDGTEKHNKESVYKVGWTLSSVLIPAFGKKRFEEITAVDIEKWRSKYIANGRSGVTANRYQAILSSIFSHVDQWVQTEKITPAFKTPLRNPCDAVEMSPSVKRERILTKYEASKLKMAFMQLEDGDGWEICKLALKSVLSMKDLKGLEIGQDINILRSKTGVPVNLPIVHLVKLNWFGWRTRWDKAREIAGLMDFQFRDLRKTGINWLKGRHNLKLVSEFAGHASIKTTEGSYTIKQSEYLEPLAKDIESQVDEI